LQGGEISTKARPATGAAVAAAGERRPAMALQAGVSLVNFL